MSLAEGGDHIGEPAMCIEGCSQAEQPSVWPAGVMCHAKGLDSFCCRLTRQSGFAWRKANGSAGFSVSDASPL
ncbi:hypothetical protein LBMAG47_04230 [Planctomycetia bacterium]|nr:hypothetical protein LBMAG47_04230 [Planctomycetia bacterium]